MIITIDGPSGTGKTTIAKQVSRLLSFAHFDTGAMYRSFSFLIKKNKVSLDNDSAVRQLIDTFDFGIQDDPKGKRYYVNGEEVTRAIRTPEISSLVSVVAALPAVREKLVTIQRKFGESQNAVFEGRDIGSVVFPDAELKIFLTATPEIRAKRRYLELIEKNHHLKKSLTIEEILEQQEERDQRDSKRKHSPLVVPDGAIVIDTSPLTIEEVTKKILSFVEKKASSS